MAPLQQINLKVPPAVLDHWRGQAAAAGLSVRDWLVTVAGPEVAPAPPAAPDLLVRVEALEAAVMELRRAPPPKQPPSPPPPGCLPQRRLTLQEAEGLLTIAAVAAAVGVTPQAVAAWMERQEGGRNGAVGKVWRGYRLLGMAQLPGGRRPAWLWQPAEDESSIAPV